MAITPTPRINASIVVMATPVITANSAYAAGNQLGGIMKLTDVVRQDGNLHLGFSELVEVTILDNNKQDAAIDIWLFNQSPTVTSSDHSAFAMTAANLQAQCIGVVSVGTAYSDASVVSVSSTANLNKPVQVPRTVAFPTSIYAIAIIRAAATYTTTSALQFQFSFFMD